MRSPSVGKEISNSDTPTNEDVAYNVPDNIRQHDFAHNSTTEQQQQHHIDRHATNHVDNQEGFLVAQEEEKPRRPSLLPRPSSIARHASFLDEDEVPPTSPPPPHPPTKHDPPVAWRDLPQKPQLALLTLARLSEPLTQTSLQAYMFYQLRSFDPSLPASTVAAQAGMLQGSFTAAQFVTAVLWGRMADAEWCGRKRVLLVGLAGTGVSCVGFGFSRTFGQAMVCRTVGGALNGNVGVMRTMISEIIKEKKFQSRAFLLLPMCFNIGVIIGPILGGLLSDPVSSYPSVFGEHSLLGGENGIYWLKHWPYALPNLMSAVFLFISAIGVVFGLEETLEAIRDQPDLGLRLGHSVANAFRHIFRRNTHRYTAVNADDDLDSPTHSSRLDSYELESRLPKPPAQKPKPRRKLPLSRIWTRNVLCTLLCHSIVALHIGTFNNLWFIHLSAPRFDPADPSPPSHTRQTPPLRFTGGLGMPPRSVGFAMATLGLIGISLQLLVYPAVNARLGTLCSFRYSLCLFPLAYTLTPYLSVVHSSRAPPHQASGVLIWLALSAVLLVQVVGRTFALPATVILVNNCSPHPSVLGTIHGIGQSVSSASRTVGPMLGGWGYGKGLQVGVVGAVWWALAVVAGVGWLLSGLVREGDGHEVWLEGEKEEEEEAAGRGAGR